MTNICFITDHLCVLDSCICHQVQHSNVLVCLKSIYGIDNVLLFQRVADDIMGRRFTVSLVSANTTTTITTTTPQLCKAQNPCLIPNIMYPKPNDYLSDTRTCYDKNAGLETVKQ